jgi:hypothetical protein
MALQGRAAEAERTLTIDLAPLYLFLPWVQATLGLVAWGRFLGAYIQQVLRWDVQQPFWRKCPV